MSAFVNTVDSVGDAALTRSIINKSVTELNDDISIVIRQGVFRACASLKTVNFPNVTVVSAAAFWGCTALTKADFGKAVTFGTNVFSGCSALTAIILRDETQISTNSTWSNTTIASGTGYIYVPAALVDTYKAASGWSTYASQIRAIEDYPEVCDPYTWDTVFKCIDNGTYADVYKVGDLVPLDLGSEGLINMQIAAFDADELADGSGKAPITWIGKELLVTSKRMNPSLSGSSGAYTEGTGTIGGWEKTEMRTYVNETMKAALPEAIRNRIKTVTKHTVGYDSAEVKTQYTTQDDVWIPSYREVFGSTRYDTEGPVYSGLFTSATTRKKQKYGASSASSWWLRSACSASYFWFVRSTGSGDYTGASGALGVALGFCFGASTPTLTITNNATNTTVTVDLTNGDTITLVPGETASITSPGETVSVYYDATASGLTYQGITCKLGDVDLGADEPFIGDRYYTTIQNQSSRGVEGNMVISGGWG